MGPEGAASVDDQRTARVRAANFFALLEALGKPKEAEAAWARARVSLDVAVPFQPGAAGALGRLDLDDDLIARTLLRVIEGFQELAPRDLVVERGRPGYPKRLAETADAPPFLFVRQDENVLDLSSLSIVGTRDASDEGTERAKRLAHLLVRRGIAVCSGLARGIDAAAHAGALSAGGVTIAVIGTPLTRVYPKEHAALQDRIGVVGAVVSQFHPTATTLPFSFPARNATMSGLSLGTVVIEASETSGAFMQAGKALQQGRKVFIPRSAIDNPKLTWPLKLAERGANVFSTIDELVGVLETEKLIPRRDQSPPAQATVAAHAS
jgi:DNA processing protein